ncbi:HalOD1 output domain-containing protein [Halosimplex marinum]|uniref:HalOD1 output domain-containing protein n=1 Tax=Halosimplex marinum TaxID=3396620 RepID=UPI003F55CC7C
MDPNAERRTYYPEEENVPLSEAVREAVIAHESASVNGDEFRLYEHVEPDALDSLFRDGADVGVSVRIRLPDVTVSIWGDGGVDIRVTDGID